jgi:hypothetical protein
MNSQDHRIPQSPHSGEQSTTENDTPYERPLIEKTVTLAEVTGRPIVTGPV